jgi:hypothetical protein
MRGAVRVSSSVRSRLWWPEPGMHPRASREGSRTWMSAGPAPGRSPAPSPRRRRSVPPGPPNPRSCGRRRAGRWPRPRAGVRIRLSNTPSKIIRSAVSSGALAEARLSTGCRSVLVESRCGSPPGNPPQVFLSHSRWIAFCLFKGPCLWSGPPSPQLCPQAAHNVAGVSAHLVHTAVHGVTWCPARRAVRMSEPSARTVSGEGRSAFGLSSLARGRSVR